MRSSLLAIFLILVVALIGGCGGSSSSAGSTTGLTLTPATKTIRVGQQTQLLAFFQGQAAEVTWSVDGGATNGTVTSGGLYTAPATAGTYTVRVALNANPGTSATSTITVQPPVTVSFGGPAPRMIPRSKFDFDAIVGNATNSSVDYSVQGGALPIEENGTFTAPTALGTYTIIARSVEDPTKTATISVEVVADLNIRFNIAGKGDIVLDLRPDQAPNTCANFVTLVNSKFYDGILFHRYVAGFVIQAGDPQTKTLPLSDPAIGSGGPGYTIPFEANPLLHEKYALAMARKADLNSAGSQFYITLDPQPSLDGDYVVFGKLLSGDTIVDALRAGDEIVSGVTELP